MRRSKKVFLVQELGLVRLVRVCTIGKAYECESTKNKGYGLDSEMVVLRKN